MTNAASVCEGEGLVCSPLLCPPDNNSFLLTDASLREFSNFLKNLEEQREIMVSCGMSMNKSNFEQGKKNQVSISLVVLTTVARF